MIQRHTLSTCLFIANPYIANFVNVHVELSMHQHFKVVTCYRFFFISNYFFLRAVIKYCFHPKAWKQYGIPIFCWSSLGLDNTLCPCSLVLRSRAIPLPLSPRICNIIPINPIISSNSFWRILTVPVGLRTRFFVFVLWVFLIYDAHEMHTISQLKSTFHDNNEIVLWGTGKFYTFLWSNKNKCLCIYPVRLIGLLTNLDPV